MKRLILVLVICVYSTTLFSQNITNTLGVGGLFIINDASNNYLTVSQSTGYLSLNKSLVTPNTTDSTFGVIFKGTDRFIHNYGTNNTFLGVNAGNFTMSGYYNTAIGWKSLYSNTTGKNNTALGWGSLFYNTEGYSNTAIGIASLYANTTGYYNTSIGDGSLFYNTTGDNNTAMGTLSLFANTTGYRNTAIGESSLYSNTSGFSSTAVGYYALYLNSGTRNTAIGERSLNNNTTGSINTALGYTAGSSVTTGNNVICIGAYSEPSSENASYQITLGDGNITSLRCAATTITSLSDARDKKNIKDLNLGIDFLMKIKPRQFNWDKREWYENNKSDGSKMKEELTAGFIAQELDEAQTTGKAEWLNLVLKDNPEKWEATPGNLLPIVVKAIQDLKKENDELKKEVESLKSLSEKLVKLEREVNELKDITLSETK